MRKLILCSITAFITCTISCNKNNDNSEDNNVIAKNEYRVKRIEGNNKIWGDYQLLFYYSNEKIDSVWRCDLNSDINKRDTVGAFYVSYNKTQMSLNITDKILTIDADSIEYLKKAFPETYKDSLRKRRTSLTLYSHEFNRDTRLENIKMNIPREDVGNGDTFNYKYLNISAQKNLFEYDKTGNPVIIRQFYDTYAQDDKNTDYERELYKYTIEYNGNKVIGVKYFIQDSHNIESWSELDSYSLTYANNILMSVEGKLYSMIKNGNTITVKERGAITTYTLDNNGNAIRADYPDGSYAKIEYEKGSGNYSNLIYPYISNILGKSIIK